MKVNGFACDQCEKFYSSNDDFYVVNRGDFIVEVCCSACLRKMASELVSAETTITSTSTPKPVGRPAIPSDKAIEVAQARLNRGGTGGATPNTEPCDICGRMIPSRQGLAAHRRKAHGKAGLPGTTVDANGALSDSRGSRASRATIPGLDLNGLGGNGRTTPPTRVESDT